MHPSRVAAAFAVALAATFSLAASPPSGLRAAPAVASQPQPTRLAWVAGSTTKVAQLTGDLDRQTGQPTLSQTHSRFGIQATDLGSSFEHDGRLFFLFGNTWGRPGLLDAVAWTASRDPSAMALDFHRASDGKWLPPSVPGVSLGAFEVPSGGISAGGKMYVVFTTEWNDAKYLMGRSVLAASEDNVKSFQVLDELSRSRFINVSMWRDGDWIYIFGSGAYRKSSVCLVRVRANDLAQRERLEYLSGVGLDGRPRWVAREQDAASLFQHDVVGEFSVSYCEPVRRYVMLYNSSEPRGIVMRSSETPWGPWSQSEIVFEPWRDRGYGHFMHISSSFKSDGNKRDAVHDPGREAEWGGEYGPYIMSRFTEGSGGRCRIFYTMSTWNPYQVVVMQTDLQLELQRAEPLPIAN